MKRVYIVEDHEDMRLIYRRVFSRVLPDIRICGEAETGNIALEQIPLLDPDLIVVDISLPGMSGLDVIRTLRAQGFRKPILVVTGHELNVYRDSALGAGANAIESKDDLSKILDAISRLMS